MRFHIIFFLILSGLIVFLNTSAQPTGILSAENKIDNKTFCNPLNLDYRFSITGASYREAADPMVVLFKDDYYIFASHCGGYWWSPDFINWTFVAPTGIDIEKYAPSVWVIGSTMYYTSSENGHIYKTINPKAGKWEYVSHPHDWNDPWVFVDTDGKVYAYFGCAENGDISCVQLDPNNKFAAIGNDVVCIRSNSKENGYEVNNINNAGQGLPWTEGGSMLKVNGKYYLTYATPGTEKSEYCDGYYVSDSPMGPFKLGANSPQTRKSTGFVTGTGHGGLFYDKKANLWTITCVALANKHWFERRLAVFPVEIDKNGLLHTNTVFGDYPQYYPGQCKNPIVKNSTQWYLLNKGKKMTSSSTFGNDKPENAADENLKTYWSAASGNKGEWLMCDLGSVSTINAIQSNFYESETTFNNGREQSFSIKYKIEYSTDNIHWNLLLDKSLSTKDTPHDYVQFKKPVKAQYLKITNEGTVPGNGLFALSDFRVFGKGLGTAPEAVDAVNVTRLKDERCAVVSWKPVFKAEGYIIRYGIAPDKLWNHYQVSNDTKIDICSLIAVQKYYFTVDAYNENGISKGSKTIMIK